MKACFFHAIEMLSPQRENVSPLICSCRSPELTVGVPWIISIQYHGQLLGARKIRFLRILSCFFQRPQLNSWVEKIRWRKDRLPTPVFLGFSCGSAGKESTCNLGDLGLIPGLGRSPGEGKGYPLQYCGLENSMDCKHEKEWLMPNSVCCFSLGKKDGKRDWGKLYRSLWRHL